MIRLFFVLALFGSVLPATAQDLPNPPIGLKPEIMLARATQVDEEVKVLFTTPVLKPRSEMIEAEVDGKKVSMTRMVYDFVKWSEVDLKVDGKTIKAYGVDGNEIDVKQLPERLKKNTRVAVVLHGPAGQVKPDPYYLAVLKEDMLVFTIPMATFYAPAQPK